MKLDIRPLVAIVLTLVLATAVVAVTQQTTGAKRKLGITGQMAPQLKVSKWIGLPNGKSSIDASDFKGKVTYLYFFQSWCPACHKVGFPTLQKLEKKFRDAQDVQFVVVQTTFEGHKINTTDKLKVTADRYDLKIPFGQSANESGTPDIMLKYRTGGTPWVVIIDKGGKVVFNDFHVDPMGAAKTIEALRSMNVSRSTVTAKEKRVKAERAVLAGGCFWGMEDLIRKMPGVTSTRVGYTGGDVRNATYRNHGTHAEAIEVVFDPGQTSYRQLLELFFQIHDPTTKNRQGNDRGMSYRSAIFYTSAEQKTVAIDTIKDVNASGLWPGKAVTEVTAASNFWEAEPEHQDYLQRNPGGYTCHFPRKDWVLPRRSQAAK